MDEFKAQDAGLGYPNHKEESATRFLCYSTTQLLYQGAGIPEERSQEASLAKCSTKPQSQGRRFEPRRRRRLFSVFSALNLTNVMCLFLLVAIYCERVICMEFSHQIHRHQANIKKQFGVKLATGLKLHFVQSSE